MLKCVLLAVALNDDGFHSFQMAFMEILPIFLIGIVLLLLICIVLYYYWDIFKRDADNKVE